MVGEVAYIEPPRETIPDHDYVWTLKKALKGLKSASLRFKKSIVGRLIEYVFTSNRACTTPLYHPDGNVRISIHVDDPPASLGVGPHVHVMDVFSHLQPHLEVRVGEAMGVLTSTSSAKSDRLAIPEATQGEDGHLLRCSSDSNWCGCQETRKSTGCAMVLWGNLLIHAHSTTQTARALSSGEVEWYGCCASAAELSYVQLPLMDVGIKADTPQLYNDATVAKSLAARQGLSRIRHLVQNTQQFQYSRNTAKLWVQGSTLDSIRDTTIPRVQTLYRR
eukprot:5215401-Amphidinium_carterae.1